LCFEEEVQIVVAQKNSGDPTWQGIGKREDIHQDLEGEALILLREEVVHLTAQTEHSHEELFVQEEEPPFPLVMH
jgi:hypothetical protein